MPRRRPRNKDYTDLLDHERSVGDAQQKDNRGANDEKFGKRSKYHQHNKTLRTAAERMNDARLSAEKKKLPIGEILQVYSLYLEVREGVGDRSGEHLLCTARRTMRKVISEEMGELVVGDVIRYRPTGGTADLPSRETDEGETLSLPEAVIESAEPRKTVLMRLDSFDENKLDPIVANAEQFMIVVSLHNPFPRWGLVDRMLVAAQTGGLEPVVIVNKADLRDVAENLEQTEEAVAHYNALGHRALLTSVESGEGLDELLELLAGKVTVLAGHSGVGKSSMIRAVQPKLDLAVGAVSEAHQKGRHTTTSARRYELEHERGGAVIDTPGVKLFGLAGVSAEDLDGFFPDVAAGNAPEWRAENYRRILESLPAADD